MTYVLDALREHGTRAVHVFPPSANVLLSFSERLANEVVRLDIIYYAAGFHISCRSQTIFPLCLIVHARLLQSCS